MLYYKQDNRPSTVRQAAEGRLTGLESGGQSNLNKRTGREGAGSRNVRSFVVQCVELEEERSVEFVICSTSNSLLLRKETEIQTEISGMKCLLYCSGVE